MTSTTSNAAGTPERTMSFDPVLRRGRIAPWRQTLQATDYRVMGPALCISADGVIMSDEQRAALWRLHKYPPGIRVLHKWNAVRLPVEELAGYHGMHEHALVNFTDTVVCDIIREGLLFVAMRFDLDVRSLLPHNVNNILPELPPDMPTLYTDILLKWNVLAPPRRLISPLELVLAYTRNSQLKSLIDTIASSLSVPTFLPITRNMIHMRDAEDDVISPEATTLAHAIQILLFAPTQWNPDIIYKRDSSQYAHRYPTPGGHGGSIRAVAGKFSLEDLHRSILLLYLTIARRTSGIMDFGIPPSEPGTFLGYFDVPRREPIADGISTYVYP
ncbi:hypothetical protein MKX08_002687 [Trichoderma sp. CBMAI-0020]|nr:hypothetical protein MKX08_002687 [Trichoderma sp. CBMAI-0020]